MGAAAKRATIYLPVEVHRAVRLKAAAADRSISDLVSEAARSNLAEDAEDLEAFEKRSQERSPKLEKRVRALRRRGTLQRLHRDVRRQGRSRPSRFPNPRSRWADQRKTTGATWPSLSTY
jgi:hypothetical protein